MVTVTPLFEGTTSLTDMPFLDQPKFLRMCMLKPVSSIETQFWFQFMLLSFCRSNTFSLLNSKVLWAVIAATTDSNYLKINEAWRTRCLWRLDRLIDPIWGNISSNASLACQSTASGLLAKKSYKETLYDMAQAFLPFWLAFFALEDAFLHHLCIV